MTSREANLWPTNPNRLSIPSSAILEEDNVFILEARTDAIRQVSRDLLATFGWMNSERLTVIPADCMRHARFRIHSCGNTDYHDTYHYRTGDDSGSCQGRRIDEIGDDTWRWRVWGYFWQVYIRWDLWKIHDGEKLSQNTQTRRILGRMILFLALGNFINMAVVLFFMSD